MRLQSISGLLFPLHFKKVVITKAKKVSKSEINLGASICHGLVFAKVLLNPPSPLGLLWKL